MAVFAFCQVLKLFAKLFVRLPAGALWFAEWQRAHSQRHLCREFDHARLATGERRPVDAEQRGNLFQGAAPLALCFVVGGDHSATS